jgi:hypothetical protein
VRGRLDTLLRFYELITLQDVLIGLVLFIITFSVSLGVVTLIIVKLPANYFTEDYPRDFWTDRHVGIRVSGILGKNILGLILVALGIVMSLPGIPGQGILTILLGIMLLDFPGKRQLERRLISRPSVFKSVNRLRARFGKPDLVVD